MRTLVNHASRRASWRGAALLALLLAACGGGDRGRIPVGRTDDDLVVTTKSLESAFASSAVKSVTRSKKDDQATAWDYRFEEQVDPPKDGVVRRRFRATVANRSDKARAIRLDIDYLEPGTRMPLKHRMLRTLVVPPFTEAAISGFTRFRDTREVLTELRAVEVEPTE